MNKYPNSNKPYRYVRHAWCCNSPNAKYGVKMRYKTKEEAQAKGGKNTKPYKCQNMPGMWHIRTKK